MQLCQNRRASGAHPSGHKNTQLIWRCDLVLLKGRLKREGLAGGGRVAENGHNPTREALGEPAPTGSEVGLGGRIARGLLRLDSLFESPDSLGQSLAEFRQLLGAEQKKCDCQNYQQMARLEQVFDHTLPG